MYSESRSWVMMGDLLGPFLLFTLNWKDNAVVSLPVRIWPELLTVARSSCRTPRATKIADPGN